MKVKAICNLTNKKGFLDLPTTSENILSFQSTMLERKNKGYIEGADINYYDSNDNLIDNIFTFNKNLS